MGQTILALVSTLNLETLDASKLNTTLISSMTSTGSSAGEHRAGRAGDGAAEARRRHHVLQALQGGAREGEDWIHQFIHSMSDRIS